MKRSMYTLCDKYLQSLPVRRAGRKPASVPSSGWCASAAPAASVAPSLAPAGVGSPAVFASPDTPDK